MKNSQKQWKVLAAAPLDFTSQFPEIPSLVLQLLYNRGLVTPKAMEEFLHPDYGQYVHDPFLFLDMDKAVRRIFLARAKKEKVLVYGDYDADGVCATALMVLVLRKLGFDPLVYIPFREKEGYGMNLEAVKGIIVQGVNLVITVDCGVANMPEVEELNRNQVDVIITDHHNPHHDLPQAFAIINPKRPQEKYPTTEICGTAVAYKLAQALLSDRTRAEYQTTLAFPPVGFEKWFLDLVAIGTVTDLMELKGESRTLLKYGLMVLNKTSRPGLRKLCEIANLKLGAIDTYSIGFQIGPRLNAAGRMDHASTSYELLVSNDLTEVEDIARDLNSKNQDRQKLSDRMYREAQAQVLPHIHDRILFGYAEKWSPSLVGLVAGKIMDEFYRPTLILGQNQDGQMVGSGRSLPGFDVTAALEKCQDLLTRFGGHSLACGFTLKDKGLLAEFKQRMLAEAQKSTAEFIAEMKIDLSADLHHINWEVMETLEKFEPFGQGNPRPKVLVKNCKLLACNPVGQKNAHLKGAVGDDSGTVRQMIGFGLGEWCQKLKPGDRIDIVCEPLVNEWNGNREIQLKLVDLRMSENRIKE